MHIEFFDDPLQQPKARDEVRIKQIGLYIHEDRRRISFGLELTPFLERPSVEVIIRNGEGESAGALTVIETMTPNFSLIIHLRDVQIRDPYDLTAEIYYATPETERVDVDRKTVSFSVLKPGEQKFNFA